MDFNYQHKYFKYKNKYLKLKSLKSGGKHKKTHIGDEEDHFDSLIDTLSVTEYYTYNKFHEMNIDY